MRKIYSGLPPRYFGLLRLSLAAGALRLVPGIPFCLAYFLPLGVWSKLLILFSPLLWYTVVGPVRIRYGEILYAFARDPAAPLRLRGLFFREQPWHHTFRERVQLVRGKVLPLFVVTAFLLVPLWVMDNVFAALKILLIVPAWIASAVDASAAFLPRLLMGEPVWTDAGVLGGVITLAAMFLISLGLFIWGMFQTGAYRFGYRRMPKRGTLNTLLKRNLLLWLPTFVLFAALSAAAYQELMLVLSNLISIEPVFAVKLEPLQIVLLGLTAASYILLVPLRKYYTARWAVEHA